MVRCVGYTSESKTMEQYYSMLLKCFAWINGKALEQYEAVKPVITFSEYGPAATEYEGLIRGKIESIRSSSSSSSVE